jgi:hypothetical protein
MPAINYSYDFFCFIKLIRLTFIDLFLTQALTGSSYNFRQPYAKAMDAAKVISPNNHPSFKGTLLSATHAV